MLKKFLKSIVPAFSYKKRLPKKFNRTPYITSPESRLKFLKFWDGEMYDELLHLADNYVQKGDVIWDIGSNVGIFSFAAANKVGENGYVLSVEPDIWLANLIQKSIGLKENKHLTLGLLPAAVSNTSGISKLLISESGRVANSLIEDGGRSKMGKVKYEQLVPIVTIEDLLKITDPPDLIKIDVEGAEARIIEGAINLLKSKKPIIHCEVGNENKELVTKLFKKHDYELYDGSTLKKNKLDKISECKFETLALPNTSN